MNKPNGKYLVGFDLGGTKMMVKVFDRGFKELARLRKKTKARDGVKSGVARIADLIREALAEIGGDEGAAGAIGLGVPGPLDLNKGIALNFANLGWGRVRLKEAMETEFGCPATVINDVDAGTYGEYRFGAAKGARCVVGIFPGTGIGGGCVYDGRIFRGKTGSCMEIGHCQVTHVGLVCGCGRKGCLETVASRLALASAAAAAGYRGQAPHLLESTGLDIRKIRSRALAESIAAGDKAVEDIVREGARLLGVAVGNVVNLMAPDIVVLGGGMVEAMPDIYLAEVERAARARAMPVFERSFKVVVAALGDEATVMGAAAWAARSAEDGQ